MFRDHPLADEGRIGVPSLVLNILWLALGGAISAIGWFFAAAVMAITIIGLPWAGAAVDNGLYTLWPFGAKAASRERLYGDDLWAGPLGVLGNLVWLILAGWWLALGHLAAAAVCAVTIIGIPFAWAHLKLAGFALWPLGRAVVRSDLAERL